jgi:hypothetical protein
MRLLPEPVRLCLAYCRELYPALSALGCLGVIDAILALALTDPAASHALTDVESL